VLLALGRMAKPLAQRAMLNYLTTMEKADMEQGDLARWRRLRDLRRRCLQSAARGSEEDIHFLRSLVRTRRDSLEEQFFPRIAVEALLNLGVRGVDELRHALEEELGIINRSAILEGLFHAVEGQPLLDPDERSLIDPGAPATLADAATQESARLVFDDFIVEAQSDRSLFNAVIAVAVTDLSSPSSPPQGYAGRQVPPPGPFSRHLMRVFAESSIVLTQRLIDEFKDLINTNEAEKEYQRFLEQHPVFLDPLAAEIYPQASLGLEYVTDFVLRRHDDRYTVVEIEKPQDRIFTLSNDFTSQFSHAIGQVLDFQGWIADNVAYAQRRLPFIENPRGLLVMGRWSNLTDLQKAKLRRWSTNSRHLDIVTYDELLTRAGHLYRSLRRIPPSPPAISPI
jgi:hypothetical protein